MIKDLLLTPQKIISVPGGDVLHAMKTGEVGFSGFGEAYFSMVDYRAIKAWKRHQEMTLNLVVPLGSIRFVVCDDRGGQEPLLEEITLSHENYCRLTVPPMVWLGFQGISENTSMLLNISNIPHDPIESDRRELDTIQFDWE
jgi:dTDP-4-dehydrorhamnose 3,5-epimerase